jgi:hypothetical protein
MLLWKNTFNKKVRIIIWIKIPNYIIRIKWDISLLIWVNGYNIDITFIVGILDSKTDPINLGH